MKYLLWDFNGTIVDDVDLGVSCINKLIKKYLKRSPLTREEYRRIFTFPVREYYERAGFDLNKFDFESLGQEWMELYDEGFKDVRVYDAVIKCLKEAINKGYHNVVISASKHDKLIEELQMLGLDSYFEEILGIEDIYAASKVALARKWAKDKNGEFIMLGDSLHDEEVAKAIGAKCILIADGHQSGEVLQKADSMIINDLRELKL